MLEINESDNVEETVAANTLGTIIHNTLEDFYKPLIGNELSIDALKSMLPKIKSAIKHHFLEIYKQGDITSGKNLIVFEIAQRYVHNFLSLEIDDLKKGNNIKIISVETELNVPIQIDELNFPIRLRGKVDRVDEYNGITRIIDYKTGKVEQNKIQIEHWEDITTDYDKHSKCFQVLCYALMINKEKQIHNNTEAGIVSFKNLKAGFIKFNKVDKENGRTQKHTFINQNMLNEFSRQLKNLILEIFNPKIDFVEKEI